MTGHSYPEQTTRVPDLKKAEKTGVSSDAIYKIATLAAVVSLLATVLLEL